MAIKFYALERMQRLATYQVTKMMAIAGISRDIFDDLFKSKVLTLELKSAHNVDSVLKIKGGKRFL